MGLYSPAYLPGLVPHAFAGCALLTRCALLIRFASLPVAHIHHSHSFRAGSYVVKDGWVGRVESCSTDVVLSFENGSQCKLYGAERGDLLARDGKTEKTEKGGMERERERERKRQRQRHVTEIQPEK